MMLDSCGHPPSPADPVQRPATHGAAGEPFFYSVASNLHRVLHLSREQHLAIWRRILDLYHRANRTLPAFLQELCQPPFVEELMEDEIFWGLVGVAVNRMAYAHATDYLPAVYATAALMAARDDNLVLSRDDQLLLSDSSPDDATSAAPNPPPPG